MTSPVNPDLPPGWKVVTPAPPPTPAPPLPRLAAGQAAAAREARARKAVGEARGDLSRRARVLVRRPHAWLVAYLVALTCIAFWPTPVDAGAGRLLRAITRLIPVLTYHRIEFGANVLLFVPLGVLLALMMSTRRYIVVPAAVFATVTIEALQGVFLGARTASVLDVVANTAGACLGLLLVELWEWWRRRQPRTTSASSSATR